MGLLLLQVGGSTNLLRSLVLPILSYKSMFF